MYKIKERHNKGVTLIVLIITVIIMLILVGVSIGIAFDNNFFDKAQNTVDKANNQITNQTKQEENAIKTWNELPGSMVKSKTSI